jgi:glycine/D-amino acid oxidase-like deaminating enzyme
LHAELAKEHSGAQRWGYRQIHCGSVSAKGRLLSAEKKEETAAQGAEWKKLPKRDKKAFNSLRSAGIPADLDWFAPGAITSYEEMGGPNTTAQVHPYQFTTSMAELAQEKEAKIVLGSVTNIDRSSGSVKSVTYEDKATKASHTIDATDVIVAAGPWTSHVYPEAPIDATRAHSVTIKADVSPYAVFTEIRLPAGFEGRSGPKRHGRLVSPEIYARPNGEIYACGEGDTLIPLPKSSDLVVCDESKCQDIVDYCASISDELAGGKVMVKQACYLPSVQGGGGPLIGPTGIKGLLLATGHTCWGIQNSCATGKVISEFLWDGEAKSADVGSLDPRRVLGRL